MRLNRSVPVGAHGGVRGRLSWVRASTRFLHIFTNKLYFFSDNISVKDYYTALPIVNKLSFDTADNDAFDIILL